MDSFYEWSHMTESVQKERSPSSDFPLVRAPDSSRALYQVPEAFIEFLDRISEGNIEEFVNDKWETPVIPPYRNINCQISQDDFSTRSFVDNIGGQLYTQEPIITASPGQIPPYLPDDTYAVPRVPSSSGFSIAVQQSQTDYTVPPQCANHSSETGYSQSSSTIGVPVTVMRSRKIVATQGASSQRGSDTERKPKIDWEALRPLLYHLYITKQCDAKEVSQTLLSVKGIHISSSTLYKRFTNKAWPEFRKNKNANNPVDIQVPDPYGSKKEDRCRAAASLPNVRALSDGLLKVDNIKSPTQLFQAPSSYNEIYFHEFKMLHCIDGLLKKPLGDKKRPWVADIVAFIPPEAEEDNRRTWQTLLNKMSSVAVMSEQDNGYGTLTLLKLGIAQLGNLSGKHDPNFLVFFWRLCATLVDVRIPGKRGGDKHGPFLVLRFFLRNLRAAFLHSSKNAKDPLVLFVESLAIVAESTPRYLKEALAIGCQKTVHMLSSIIGQEAEPIILGLSVLCVKSFRRTSVNRTRMYDIYEHHLKPQQMYSPPELLSRIAILYDYINAISEGKYVSEIVKVRAIELLRMTQHICEWRLEKGRLRYDLTTRAYAFASEMLSLYHLETWKLKDHARKDHHREVTFEQMNEAIALLSKGDLDCLVRAASCSKRRAVWLAAYRPGRPHIETVGKGTRQKEIAIHRAKGVEAAEEKNRKREIMTRISSILRMKVDNLGGDPVGGTKNTRWRRKKAAQRAHAVNIIDQS